MIATDVRRRRHATTRVVSLAVGLAAGLSSAPLHAQPTEQDRTVAQSLFDRARTLAEAGKYGEACPLFEESQRLDPGAGTQLNLALCYEGEARLAKAYALFNESLSAAIKDGRSDRRAIAEEHLSTLGPRLSMITIAVPDDARVPELILWLDGEKISSASTGVPLAVDGGAHRVEATARHHHPFSTAVEVKAEHDHVTVTIPPLVAFGGDALAPRASDSPAPRPTVAPSPPSTSTERTPVALALTFGGLGLVALGAGTGIAALVRDGQAQDLGLTHGCNLDRGYCPAGVDASDALGAQSQATALGWTSTLSLGVGVTSFVVGLALPKRKVAHRPSPHGGLTVAPSPGGVGLRVGF